MPVLDFPDEVCEDNKEEVIWIRGDVCREWLSLHPPAAHSGLPIHPSQLLLIFTSVWQTSSESEKPSPFFPSQLPFLPAGFLGPSGVAQIALPSHISRPCHAFPW